MTLEIACAELAAGAFFRRLVIGSRTQLPCPEWRYEESIGLTTFAATVRPVVVPHAAQQGGIGLA
jgi:hypothetical protein